MAFGAGLRAARAAKREDAMSVRAWSFTSFLFSLCSTMVTKMKLQHQVTVVVAAVDAVGELSFFKKKRDGSDGPFFVSFY